MKTAAGVLVLAADTGRALFVRSSETGLWELPGGRLEQGETPKEGAMAELAEETGYVAEGRVAFLTRTRSPTADYTTFWTESRSEFVPVLSSEHTVYAWEYPSLAPEPMQPGLRALLKPWLLD